jgi:hypothetical protein
MRRGPGNFCPPPPGFVSSRCSGNCAMSLTTDGLSNDTANGTPDDGLREGTVNDHPRLTPEAGQRVSLALARWALAILTRPRGPGGPA